MTIRSTHDLDALEKIGALVAQARDKMRDAVRAGMTTAELDLIGEHFLQAQGARSAPQMVYQFPGFNCISVNDEVVHGIPGNRAIAPGDLVKIDVTAELDGYIADSATTVLVPPENRRGRKLLACAQAAFRRAMRFAKAGNPVNAIGRAVQSETKLRGFSVIRELSGHGVGRSIHEKPEVANYFDPDNHTMLTEGMVIAVEPILSERPADILQSADGWTLSTSNHCLAVHYEHTIVITRTDPIILTAS
jgi:methionyl aminopeptidase